MIHSKDDTCYLGSSTNVESVLGEDPQKNKTLYATMDFLNSITSSLAYKDNVISDHWTKHIEQSHSDAIETLQQCQALTLMEYWHYSVYDSDTQTCYFGKLKTENSIDVDVSSDKQISINYDELTTFVPDTFVERESYIYNSYTYVSYVYPVNEVHCGVHCFFDSDNKCDFFFIYGSYCYLGNFNEDAPIGSSTATVTTYIYNSKTITLYLNYIRNSIVNLFSAEVSDHIAKLYPTKVDAGWNKLKTKLKDNFKVVSELECGAHAALATGDTDIWSYNSNTKSCFLGELTNNNAVGSADGLREVRVIRSKRINIRNIIC